MSFTTCPSDADLSAFALGELAPAAVDRLAAHVNDCVECRARLEQLDERSNDVVLAIRRGTRDGRATRAASATSDATPIQEQPTVATAPPSVSHLPAPPPPPPEGTEGPGTRIGNYRLQQLLGEGGFGSVFLAEQTSPVRRQVALKLIKLGMDTRQVLARFQAERQALAMMDHPNIARVLDAGTTDRGRPFFVMELAKGVAITDYCDAHQLPTRKRLELYANVCDAVQHAHTKGVIHRDIKPNNVLVTMRDGGPVPKVIDFGIAKAIGGRLTDQTLYTEIRHFLGTPEYMSPEQADGAGLDIDSRTDIYSLGVLLYELLTGTTPFDPKELRAKGIDKIGQTIREVDPPRPSTRVSLLGSSVTAVAAKRATDPRKLSQSLRGELDWIVMKCLEKDRTLRYDSAAALADDVRRYLKDEPVRAGPPGAAYQVRKFVRRNRARLAAAAVVVLSIGLGLTLAITGIPGRNNPPSALDTDAARKAAEAARAAELANAEKFRAQVDAVFAASPQSVVPLIDTLRATPGDGAVQTIRGDLRRRLAPAAPGTPQRLRAAIALTLLGEPMVDDLVKAVATAPASEGHLIAAALAASAKASSTAQTRPAANAIAQLNALAGSPEASVRTRARYATLALSLGDVAQTERVLAQAPDPAPRYAFLTEFAQWHGDLAPLPAIIRGVSPEARGGLCIAIGRLKPAELPDSTRQSLVRLLSELYASDPSGAVHMACGYALRQWQAELPDATSPATEGNKPRGWFVGKSGLTMVRVPAGFTVIGDERDGFPSVPVLFTQPLYASATEVPHSLFKQFAEDADVAETDRPAGWLAMQARFTIGQGPSDAAAGMSLLEAARFCNWLSLKEGRLPCYTIEGDKPEQWRIDPAADGFRIPTAPEWEYLARAGSTLRYPVSDDGEYLEEVVMQAPTGSSGQARLANVQPNRWGLVNTLGGVWEMCWYTDLLHQPGHAANPGLRPVIDPRAVDGGPVPVIRGGAVGTGLNEKRSAFLLHGKHGGRQQELGFRVVCAASAPGAPPEVVPPQDPGELWMWATQVRPASPILATRAAEWIAAHAQVDGRNRQFKKAADKFQKAAELKKDDLVLWWYVATLRLIEGDRAAHRAAWEQMLRITSVSETAGNCDRTAKVMLLDPTLSTTERSIATDKAARALELGGESPAHRGWFLLVMGMADYRDNKLPSAIERLEQARESLESRSGRVSIDLFRAMALHRAGRREEARKVFDGAKAVLDEVAPLDATDWTIEWVDWATGRFTLAEAERVMKL